MPESRHYVVTQTRSVQVSANTPVGAAEIAALAFDGKDARSTRFVEGELDIWGYQTSEVRPIEMTIKDLR